MEEAVLVAKGTGRELGAVHSSHPTHGLAGEVAGEAHSCKTSDSIRVCSESRGRVDTSRVKAAWLQAAVSGGELLSLFDQSLLKLG